MLIKSLLKELSFILAFSYALQNDLCERRCSASYLVSSRLSFHISYLARVESLNLHFDIEYSC